MKYAPLCANLEARGRDPSPTTEPDAFRIILKWTAGLLFAYCSAFAVMAAQAITDAPVAILPEAGQVPVWQALRIVAPADRTLTPLQAAERLSGDAAFRVGSADQFLARGTAPYWASFSLNNPGTSALMRVLALELTTQFDVALFEREQAGTWRRVSSQADTGSGRIGSGSTHPTWALQLEPRRTVDFLLRVEGPSLVRFPLFVYDPLDFSAHERSIHVLIGLALGTWLFIGVYVGSLRRHIEDASVPLFICMLTADLVGALWLSGFLSELLPAVPESTLSPIGIAAYAILFGSGCLHARIYLSPASWSPRIDRLLQGLGWLWLGMAPWLGLAFPVASRIFIVWGGTGIAMLLLVVSTLATRRRIPFSGYIAAAWLAYLVVGSIFMTARITGDHLFWLSPTTVVLAQATLVAVLFGLAMSQRLMQQRDHLIVARRDAMMQQVNAAAVARERGLLFAATNHDMRQPLVGVSLFANLLKSAVTPEERDVHAHKLDMAIREIDGLLVGIEQLANVNDTSYRPTFDTVRLDDLLLPVIEEYRIRSEYKHITIRYVSSRLSITTHVPYFQRIVRNALSNAIRYTNQGDRVLVGYRRANGLRLVIADTGRGMTEEQTKRAFDAYQQFDTEMSMPQGFGLGLYSVRTLANALGLTVRLRSQYSRGTKFSISLPSQ